MRLLKSKIVIIIFALLLTFTILYLLIWKQTQTALNETEIKSIINEQYTGEIQEIKNTTINGEQVYSVTLNDGYNNYIVNISHTGDILSINLESSLEQRESELPQFTTAIPLTEINKIIEETVQSRFVIMTLALNETNNKYVITGRTMTENFYTEIDSVTGQLLLLQQQTDNIRDEEVPKTPSIISEEEAVQIALSFVSGEIDDVEVKEQNGSTIYEIEIEADKEDLEATVYIDAYTGELVNIIWED